MVLSPSPNPHGVHPGEGGQRLAYGAERTWREEWRTSITTWVRDVWATGRDLDLAKVVMRIGVPPKLKARPIWAQKAVGVSGMPKTGMG